MSGTNPDPKPMSEEPTQPETEPEQEISDPAPLVTPDGESEMDAALTEIEERLGVEDPDGEKTGAPSVREGVQDPTLFPEEEPAETAAEPEETDESGEPEREADGDDLTRAISALRRDGLPKSLISTMTDEQILEVGSKRAKVQGDTDEAFRQLSELKNLSEPDAEESGAESPDVAAPAAKPAFANLDEALTGFTDIFGDEAAGALRAPLEAAITPVTQQLEQGRNQLGSLMQTVEDLMVTSARANLSEKFPGLGQDTAFADVRTRMKTLVKSGGYNDMETLMSDASRIEFSDESAEAIRASRISRDRHRSNGQPTPGSSRIPAKAMTSEEAEDAVLMALEAGDSVADARRHAGLQ